LEISKNENKNPPLLPSAAKKGELVKVMVFSMRVTLVGFSFLE
jgi:hypothetical protein